jgi:molybdate/tungstate transport system substrate-binding protein
MSLLRWSWVISLLMLLLAPPSAADDRASDSRPIRGSGAVQVIYAGSLTRFFEKKLGPAFEKATGFTFQGEGKGSVAIANLIKGKVKTPDVFVSADPAVDVSLHGEANGNYVSWWVPFARTEMVIAWSPKGPFRKDFEAASSGKRSWESVLKQPGVRLGRTDPELDPKGYRALFLFELEGQLTGETGLAMRILEAPDNPSQIFPEEQMVARLQVGELDAGIFYLIEAIEAGLPYLRLPASINQSEPGLAAQYARVTYRNKRGTLFKGASIIYTITIPSTVQNARGAEAFVKYLLSKTGRELLSSAGLLPVSPSPEGTTLAIPSTLKPFLRVE